MSLHTRYCPGPLHAGPSAHNIPVRRRWSGVFPILYFAKRLSSAIMSGSGYRPGFLPLQSRWAEAAGIIAALLTTEVRKLRRFITSLELYHDVAYRVRTYFRMRKVFLLMLTVA